MLHGIFRLEKKYRFQFCPVDKKRTFNQSSRYCSKIRYDFFLKKGYESLSVLSSSPILFFFSAFQMHPFAATFSVDLF